MNMTCPRGCGGFVTVKQVQEDLDSSTEVIDALTCINCGWYGFQTPGIPLPKRKPGHNSLQPG